MLPDLMVMKVMMMYIVVTVIVLNGELSGSGGEEIRVMVVMLVWCYFMRADLISCRKY